MSTSSATPTNSTTASCPKASRTRPGSLSPTAPSTPSASRSRPAVTVNPPVADWTTDFDHTDPEWVNDPFPIWEKLRTTCPVAHSDRYGGAWLPTSHEDVSAIAYDTDHFTSRAVV